MAKHAKKEKQEISMPLSKLVLSAVLLLIFGLIVGGVIAYIMLSDFPTKLLVI